METQNCKSKNNIKNAWSDWSDWSKAATGSLWTTLKHDDWKANFADKQKSINNLKWKKNDMWSDVWRLFSMFERSSIFFFCFLRADLSDKLFILKECPERW